MGRYNKFLQPWISRKLVISFTNFLKKSSPCRNTSSPPFSSFPLHFSVFPINIQFPLQKSPFPKFKTHFLLKKSENPLTNSPLTQKILYPKYKFQNTMLAPTMKKPISYIKFYIILSLKRTSRK